MRRVWQFTATIGTARTGVPPVGWDKAYFSLRILTTCGLGFLCYVISSFSATAQLPPMDGGFGGPPGGFMAPPGSFGPPFPMEMRDRGDFRRGGDRGSDLSPEERADRYVGFMSRLDENQDGFVSKEEIEDSRFARFIVPRLSERTGKDVSNGFRISEVREGLINYYRREQEGAGEPSSSPAPFASSGSGGQTSAPEVKVLKWGPPGTVPGFGVTATSAPRPQGFGISAASGGSNSSSEARSDSPGSSASPAAASSQPATQSENQEESRGESPPPPPIDERIRRYAESLMQRYDENKSGILEKDEWSKMRGDWAPGDRDGDGNISKDELAGRLAEMSGVRRPSGAEDDRPSPPATAAPVAVKRYRFSSPYDRMPDGLPSWFRERDKDRDGQVMMAEFADRWAEDTYRQFAKYDLNGDGVITPKECLKTERVAAARGATSG